jgi:MFS family permease
MNKKVLFSASLFHALNDAATVVAPMAFPILYNQHSLITSYSQMGILSNFGLLTTICIQILVVVLADKIEYKTLLFVSFVGISGSLVLMTYSSSFMLLLLFFMLMRVFTSFYHPIGIAWVSKTNPSQGMDFAMGIQSGSGNFGVFAAFITAGYIAQRSDWRQPLILWAIIGAVLGFISFWAVRRTSSRGEELRKAGFASWMATLKQVKPYIFGLIYGGFCWAVTISFAPSLLNHKFQIPIGRTGLYLGLWMGLGTVINYFYGALSRWLGRFTITLCALTGGSVCLLIIGFVPKKGIVLPAFILYGAFLFLTYPSLQSWVGSTVDKAHQAQAFSLTSNIQMFSGAMTALGAGFLSDKYGIQSPFMFIGLLGILIAGYYLGKGPRFLKGDQAP